MEWLITASFQTFRPYPNPYARGYSRAIFPYISYYLCYEVLGYPITERSLILIHSAWGVCACLAVFSFACVFLSQKRALIALALIGMAPSFVNYSRYFIGPFSVEITFFYLGLTCLFIYYQTRLTNWLIAYSVSTFFFLGAGNLIFIDLFTQITFVYFLHRFDHIENPGWKTVLFFKHWSTTLFILLPAVAIVFTAIVFYSKGLPFGQIMHVIFNRSDVSNAFASSSLNIFKFLQNLPNVIGPIVFLFPVALYFAVVNRRNVTFSPACSAFLFVYFILFSILIILSRRPYYWYAIMLDAPAILFILSVWPKRFLSFLLPVLIYSAWYSYQLNYNPEFDVGAAGFYSRNIERDTGLRALAFLVREGKVPVTTVASRPPFGQGEIKSGIFMHFEGAWFYLGTLFHDWVIQDTQSGAFNSYENFIYVVRTDFRSEHNVFAEKFAEEKKLHLIATIRDPKGELMRIYSNAFLPHVVYNASELTEAFINKYGNIPSLSWYWLGCP